MSIQLETPRVRLRHVRPDDYPRLHEIESDPASLATWRYRGRLPSLVDYEAALWQQTQALLVIEGTADDTIRGYVHLHDVEPRAGHGWFSIYASADVRGRGLVMEGTLLFGDWVFGNTSLRWMYAHVFDVNMSQFSSAIKRDVLLHLGTYRDRVEVDGRAMDVHVLGSSRERWAANPTRARLRRLLDRDRSDS